MNVLIGISASVAAHRALDLASALRKQGHEVATVLSGNAGRLIAVAAIEAITGRRAVESLWTEGHTGTMDHLALAKWADVFVVCPASADAIANMAHGLAPDALTTLALAWPPTRPLLISPAMNPAMYAHSATQENVATLKRRGARFIGPVHGETACRDEGVGRLAPVEEILQAVLESGVGPRGALSPPGRLLTDGLTGRTILITGGPTVEALDPVRMLTNPSSGRMAVALAAACQRAGAKVELVLGPCPAAANVPEGISHVAVRSAENMLEAVVDRLAACDAAVFAAAVSDFRPVGALATKLNKDSLPEGRTISVEFERTPDVALNAAARKRPGQIFIGFSADTYTAEQEAALAPVRTALGKARRKRFDLVFSNPVGRPGTGFEADNNAGWLVEPVAAEGSERSVPVGWEAYSEENGGPQTAVICHVPIQSKSAVAEMIVEWLARRLSTSK